MSKIPKNTFTGCFINGAFLQRFSKKDLLMQPPKKKKRKMLSKRGTKRNTFTNPTMIRNSSSTG